MQNLHSLKKRISSTESLQSIVTTMKAHASANIAQFEHAADASMIYRSVLDKALYVALSADQGSAQVALQETKNGNTIHIVFGSDHGLAGRFNERMASFALGKIPTDKKHVVIVVGKQIHDRLDNHFAINASFPVPQTEDGIIPIVQRILFKVDQLRDEAPVGKILLYYSKMLESSIMREETTLLFPVDLASLSKKTFKWDSNSIPTILMNREDLIRDLLKQYFFLTLYRSFCHSLVSENTSRIASMNSAEKAIEERLLELNLLYRTERQTNITEEISDVISGFKSIKNKNKA